MLKGSVPIHFRIIHLLFLFRWIELVAYIFKMIPRVWIFQKIQNVRFESSLSSIIAFQILQRRCLLLFFTSSISFQALESEGYVVILRTFLYTFISWHLIIISPLYVVAAKRGHDNVVQACHSEIFFALTG